MISPGLMSLKLLQGCRPMELHDEDEFDVTKDFSRIEAFEIGVLIDLSRQAREAGIRYPLAITTEVYQVCLIGDEDDIRDEMERALDLVTQVATIARMSPGVSRVHFDFVRDDDEFREVPLVLICSLGDFGETVLTIVLED